MLLTVVLLYMVRRVVLRYTVRRIMLRYTIRWFIKRVGRRVWAAITNLRLWKVTSGIVLSLAIVIGLVVAVQIIPEWQVNRAGVRSAPVKTEATATAAEVANLQNEMRKTVLQVLGGLFAIFALYLTFRRVKVAEQGHITDRFTKAIEQLGALTAKGEPNVGVRLGAIYALERIAQDSPRDHWTIMEVLTAYVRQNAPAPAQVPTKKHTKDAIAKGPATEIQAILTVLGRRKRDRGREHEGQYLDLSSSNLRGANISSAHMEGANFYETHLEGAHFWSAHVEGAGFDRAHVEGASFRCAVGLTVEQFEYVQDWNKAEFDEAFRSKLEAAEGKGDSQG